MSDGVSGSAGGGGRLKRVGVAMMTAVELHSASRGRSEARESGGPAGDL